jgi:hypothetical protein
MRAKEAHRDIEITDRKFEVLINERLQRGGLNDR